MIYFELAKRFWPYILAFILFGIGYGYGHHNDHVSMQAKLDALQHDYDKFVADVQAQGEAAQKASDEAKAQDQHNKGKADEDYNRTIAGLTADNQRLRDKERSRGNILPPAAASSSDPATAKINRTDFESAYRQLVAGLQAIGTEGDEGMIGLDNAKAWAQNQAIR